jgi:hypothetical protein
MGLDTSHDCWHGSYHGFNRWRIAVASAADIVLDYMMGHAGERPGLKWDESDPLSTLLHHSDSEGDIPVEKLLPLAERLRGLLDKLPKAGERLWQAVEATVNGIWWTVNAEEAEWIRTKAEQFIAGLERAAAAGEPVTFG